MSNCVPHSFEDDNKQFIELIKSVFPHNPLEMAKMFSIQLGGEIDHLKTKAQVVEALKTVTNNLKASSKQSSSLIEGVEGVPLSRFTKEDREEIVDNLIFLAVWDGKEDTIKDEGAISTDDLKEILIGFRDQGLSPEMKEKYKDNYDEILKPENFEALKFEVERKLARLGASPEIEEDADGKAEGSAYAESFLLKNLDRARVSSKLLTAFLVEDSAGNVLGLQKFSDFVSTWNDLEDMLTDIPDLENGSEDKYDSIVSRIKASIHIKPQYDRLLVMLENADETKRTQFVRSFDNTRVEFLQEVVSDPKHTGAGFPTQYMTSAGKSRVSKLESNWDSRYLSRFLSGKRHKKTINKETVDKVLLNYNKISGLINSAKETSPELVDMGLKMVKALGINMNSHSFNAYLNTNGEELKTLQKLFSTGGLIHIIKGKGNNTLTALSKGILTVNEEKGFKSPLKDNKIVIELASVQKRFEEHLEGSGVAGPDGKTYQTIGQHDSITKAINSMATDNRYLDSLDSPYSAGSRFIPHLKQEKNKEKLKVLTYLSRRKEGEDNGLDLNSTSVIDETASRIERLLHQDQVPYFTAADKNKVYYFEGMPISKYSTAKLKKSDIDLFTGYLVAEINTMRKAWEEVYGEEKIEDKKQILHYHYKTDGKGNRTSAPGNAFSLPTFPSLNPGTQLAKDLGLYDETNNNKPFAIATSLMNDEGEVVVGIDSLTEHVVSALNERIEKRTQAILDTMIKVKNGKISHTSFSDKTKEKFLSPYENNLSLGAKIIATNYTINTMIANIEYTKMFTGDPRMYKSIDDYLKRIPSTTATGDYMRIVKGEVRENFKIAVAPNVDFSSELLYDSEVEDIIEFVGATTKKEVAEMKEIISAYSEVNRTDAQGWITMSRYKEILIGLGEWDSKTMPSAFDNIVKGNASFKDFQVFSKKMSTMQPKKGVHFELVKDSSGNMVPVYLKYSQAILFPQFIQNSKQLTHLAEQMEKNDISEVIVGDGVKAGAIEDTTILTGPGVPIEFNSIKLSNRSWKLQLELPSKGVTKFDALVGSQAKKNIIADINPQDMYGGMTGEELINAIHVVDSELSNKGLEKALEAINSTDNKADKKAVYEMLIKEFQSDGESANLIGALRAGVPVDNILSHRQVIWNKLSSLWAKKTVKLKQPGGAAIQISDFGFERGMDMRVFDNLGIKDYNGIVWLKDPKNAKLMPPKPVKNENGEGFRFSPGEVLLPYNKLAKLFGKEWRNIKKLPFREIVKLIDADALNLIGYRIPNQALASNDSLKIVGILPPHAGDSIVAYSEITMKTGSDFDIDKMFYIQPAVEYNKETGRVEAVKYDSSIPASQNSEAQLHSRRVDLYKLVLESPHSYKRLMKTIDGSWLKDLVNVALPKPALENWELYDGAYQMEIRREFLASKSGVGPIANHQSDNAISQSAGLSIREDSKRLDIGRRSSTGALDLSISTSKNFEVIEHIKDAEGNITGYKITDNLEDSFVITEVITAYMNAFVDAAKDNYIGRANFNNLTINAAMLLIRNGVSPQYVTALMAQPVIQEYVRLTNTREGQSVEKNSKKPEEILMEGFGLEVEELSEVSDSKLSEFSTKELLDMLISSSQGESASPLVEAKILSLFLHTQKVAKHLSKQLQASKADTSPPRNLDEAIIKQSLFQNVLNRVVLSGRRAVENFQNKFNGTMLGTYHENGVNKFVDNFKHLAISGTDNMQYFANKAYKEIYGELPSDYKKLAPIMQMAYAAMMSTNPAFNKGVRNKDGNGIADLMDGKNSIATRLTEYKESPLYANNKLVDMLYVRSGYNSFDYVGIDNSKQKDVLVSDRMTEDWLSLYRSKDAADVKFAEDLVTYAFHTSALTDNLGSIYRLIPYQILSGMGVTLESNTSMMGKLNNPTKRSDTYTVLFDQVMRNLWRNTDIIPKVASKNALATPVSKTKGEKFMTFQVNEISSPNLVAGPDELGSPVFKPYVQREEFFTHPVTQHRSSAIRLYKYIGNRESKGVVNGVYERVGLLGEHSKRGNKLFEFSIGTSGESFIPTNKFTLPAKFKQKELQPVQSVYVNGEDAVPDMPNEENTSKNLVSPKESSNIAYSEYLETSPAEAIPEEVWDMLTEDEKKNRLDCSK